jgi:hypothetical protein
MGLFESWGGLASRFAEAGVVDGLLPYRSGAGKIKLAKGVVRLPVAVQNFHVRSAEFVVGDLVANTEVELNLGALADGFYRVYAHPVVDGSNVTTGVEIAAGAKLLKAKGGAAAASLAEALAGYDAGAANGTSIATVPEPAPDVSAFKMAVAVPASDFYKGRDVLLAVVQIAAGDVAAVDVSAVHRLR